MFPQPALKLAIAALCVLGFGSAAPRALAAAEIREVATFVTSSGTMQFELFKDISPLTVANFKYLSECRFYDGTAFHRLVPFDPYYIAQGGDPLTRDLSKASQYGSGGPGYTVPDERTSDPRGSHVRGIISMARSSEPNTQGSQFFIMLGDFTAFDGQYAPFGKLIDGDETFSKFQAEAVSGAYGFTKPVSRLSLDSVSIQSQLVSGTLLSSYPAATVGGLIRDIDRNIFGSYRLSLTSKGSVSGQVVLDGRTLPFVGKLPVPTQSLTEAETVIHFDSRSVNPVRLKLRLRKTGVTTAVVSLRLSKLEGTDPTLSNRNETGSVFFAARDLSGPVPALSERYTISFDQPWVAGAYSSTLQGCGYLTIRHLSLSGACVAVGKLADGRPLSASFLSSAEGGRNELPLFLSGQSAGGLNSKVYGGLQVLSNQRSEGLLRWLRPKLTGANAADEMDAYLRTFLAAWSAPKTGEYMNPFSISSGIGLIKIGSLDLNGFNLSPPNIAPVFYSNLNSVGITLKFNPLLGTFSGSYPDKSLGFTLRKTFEGVCIQGSSASNGFGRGFSSRLGLSDFVVLLPP